jgi:hypothetical protein
MKEKKERIDIIPKEIPRSHSNSPRISDSQSNLDKEREVDNKPKKEEDDLWWLYRID